MAVLHLLVLSSFCDCRKCSFSIYGLLVRTTAPSPDRLECNFVVRILECGNGVSSAAVTNFRGVINVGSVTGSVSTSSGSTGPGPTSGAASNCSVAGSVPASSGSTGPGPTSDAASDCSVAGLVSA